MRRHFTLDIGLCGEVEVATIRLGFTRERIFEVLQGIASLQIHFVIPSATCACVASSAVQIKTPAAGMRYG